MGSEVSQIPVADLIAAGDLVINDGYRAKNSELSSKGLPFARAQNINNGFHFEDADRFPEQDLAKVGIKISQPSDVVFTSKGTVGRFALVRPDTPRFVYAPQLCFWRSLNPDRIDPRWLYYWMNSREFFVQFKGVSGQTDMAEYVSLRDQRAMHITLPDIADQRRIAHILGTLDDKIELNRRMNRTLEKMAAAIFKSWFIDFNPVHVKAQGRAPNLPPEIAALFPNSFEGSELGPIPRWWKVKPIGDAVPCVGGATPSTKNPEYWDGGTHPFVTPKDMSSLQSPVIFTSERHITDLGVEKISSKQLPAGTVLLSSRAPIGYLAIAGVPVSVNQGIIAMICDRDLPNIYVYHWIAANMETIKSRAGGTTFAEISKRSFRPIPVLIPSAPVTEVFTKYAQPLHDRIALNVRQNRRLAALRDTLLPKLLNGEIELSAVESIAEEVA